MITQLQWATLPEQKVRGGMENFSCPACARRLRRPLGSETFCPCGEDVPPTTVADMVVRMLDQSNELLAECEVVDDPRRWV